MVVTLFGIRVGAPSMDIEYNETGTQANLGVVSGIAYTKLGGSSRVSTWSAFHSTVQAAYGLRASTASTIVPVRRHWMERKPAASSRAAVFGAGSLLSFRADKHVQVLHQHVDGAGAVVVHQGFGNRSPPPDGSAAKSFGATLDLLLAPIMNDAAKE